MVLSQNNYQLIQAGRQAKLVLYNFYIEGNYIVDAVIRLILQLCLSMV
jgi:hypothetical protein